MKKAIRGLLLLTAFLPIVVIPSVLSPFLTGKTLVLRGILFIVALLATILFIQNHSSRTEVSERFRALIRQPLTWALGAFLLILVISTLTAFDPYFAFFSDIVRQDGFLGIITFYFLYIFLTLYFTKKDWTRFLLLTVPVSVVLFIVQAVQATKGMIRPDSLIGNPIFLSMYYAFTLYACGVIWARNRSTQNGARGWLQAVAIIVALLAVLGILMTKSRGILVGIAVGVVVSLLYIVIVGKNTYFGKAKFSVRKWAIGILVITLLGGTGFYLTRHKTFWTHIPIAKTLVTISSTDATTQARIVNTKIALSGFSPAKEGWKRVLLGWGQDNFIFMWNKNYTPELFGFDRGILDRAHDKLVDVLVMQGIFGLLAYLSIWIAAFALLSQIRIGRLEKTLLLFALVSYFVANLFVFDTVTTYLVFFYILAYLSQSKLSNENI